MKALFAYPNAPAALAIPIVAAAKALNESGTWDITTWPEVHNWGNLAIKDEAWLLFDNLDKGWTPGGVTQTDILMLRCLLDVVRKIGNDVRRSIATFRGIVFVRNDVDFMIDMSLMRPRNLLKLFNYARGVAVNRRHSRIEVDDVLEGVKVLSDDVLVDVTNEMRDVLPESRDFLYRFIAEAGEYSREEIGVLALEHNLADGILDRLIEHLLYYGVFGIKALETGTVYVYDLGYDMKRMRMLLTKFPKCVFVMHPILRPALGIR
jgi:hypothetical protein